MRIILKALVVVLATLAAIPLLLTVVYAFVDPPSMPIARRHALGEPVAQAWRPLSAMSPELVQAVVMAEDARFCLHWGVDLRQVRIVVADAFAGRRVRGASTITMQVARNLFLWSERSYLRKAIEVPLALWIDLVLSKDRILEIYLNIAQWGARAYGVEAGAQLAFGKGADRLTGDEALALATVLPAPAVRDPRAPSLRQRRVMAHVRDELARAPWVFACLPPRIRP
ncbi:transglycosylase domain-containing protein [Acuticoccus sp.]|uniref:transglycosylase domain-containing protein n=1 Tax=Acuticoccus sp. TaxID=1904378 RepID=UPI003B529501